MPSAKDGKAGSIVAPTAPTAPHDADEADPVEVAQAKARELKDPKTKYGAQQVQKRKHEKTEQTETAETTWIEIKLNDKDGQPVPGEAFEVWSSADEPVATGTLDEHGFARVEGLEPGSYQITFPRYDKRAWKPA